MGRGRKPKPTALHIAQGTYRPDRHGQRVEASGTPEDPGYLDGDAREMWERLVPQLTEMGILKRVDSDALAACCRWWALWRQYDSQLQRGDGDPYKVTIQASMCYKNFLALLPSFGMTPAARSKLVAEDKKDNQQTPFERFLAGQK